jgi:6-phosphogluconolactonase (cycloisomerase 2 family)
VAANGAFTFAGAAVTATAYTVTVSTQPTTPAQTCTVTNGAGTIAAANVTNITVTCTTNTHTIGGVASGLAGTGLTLRNNGGGDLAVTANGAFTFAAPVTNGGAYAVTIATQPANPSQTCTLANASGTATANVSNITVTCATNTYTVGGTVSGFAGTGLTLRNNGGSDLAITANGAFTFAAPVVSGGPYAVTVATQPSNPAQTCLVANANGTVSASNISSVVITCQTNGFSVGGTVSGLLGSGLELQINGARDLLVSNNGSFHFINAVLAGQSYTVTIKTQPSSPAQTCVLFNATGAIANAGVANLQLTCTSAGSRFAYVTGLPGIYCYAIDAISHALVPLPNPPCDAGVLTGVAIDPLGKYAYSADSTGKQIVPYTINQATGALTRIAGAALPAGDNPIAAVVHTTGNFVYVMNEGSDNISAYRITPSAGAVTAVAGSPFAAGGHPNSIVMDRSGSSIYVVNATSGNVSGFAINPATGALLPIAGSPFAVSTIPTGIAVSPQNSHVLVSGTGTDRVHVYARNATTGALTQVAGSPFVAGTRPTGVGFDNFGAYAYVTNQSSNDISAFAFNATTGVLTPVAGSPFPRAGAPSQITAHPADRFVYVSNLSTGTVSTFSYTQATGALTEVGSPVAASGLGAGANIIAIAP